MTHDPPRSEHLDLEQLADLDEDLLAPAETAAADEHLAGCGQCRQRRADIRSTRALLSTLPAESVPAAVASRIDATLASLPATTIVPLTVKRRRWRAHPTMAGLGAAATVAALVGALVVARTSSHHPSPADSTEAAGAAPNHAALALPQTTASGTKYTATNLASTVPALLNPQAAPLGAAAPTKQTPGLTGGAPAKTTAMPPSLTRLFTSSAALEECVRKVEQGGPPIKPLAIDFATYQDKPTLLIVLPPLASAPAGTVGAWFVGPNCDATFDDLQTYLTVPTSPPSPPPGG